MAGAAAASLLLLAGCGSGNSGNTGSSGGGGATSGLTAPTENQPVPSQVGKPEGALNLIAWEGY
ncbi:MAG: hypothetical protein ACTHOK_10550, partial [Nocardioidaceae bacterium]